MGHNTAKEWFEFGKPLVSGPESVMPDDFPCCSTKCQRFLLSIFTFPFHNQFSFKLKKIKSEIGSHYVPQAHHPPASALQVHIGTMFICYL